MLSLTELKYYFRNEQIVSFYLIFILIEIQLFDFCEGNCFVVAVCLICKREKRREKKLQNN